MALFGRKKKTDDTAVKKTDEQEIVMPTTSLPTGGDMSSYQGIKGPHVTEKASLGASIGKYAFRVTKEATKIGIKRSIEQLYKVSVIGVHVSVMPSKVRQVGGHKGIRSEYKKAIVTLKKGDKIDIVG